MPTMMKNGEHYSIAANFDSLDSKKHIIYLGISLHRKPKDGTVGWGSEGVQFLGSSFWH